MLRLVLHCTGVVPWGAKDNYATPWVLMAYRVFGSSGQEQRHSPQGHDPTPTRPDTDPMHSTANADASCERQGAQQLDDVLVQHQVEGEIPEPDLRHQAAPHLPGQ